MLRSLLSRITRTDDPYEDFYLNAVPADPRNLIVNRLRQAPDGSVFAVKAETHTPEVMSDHIRELGRFFGADEVHIVSTKRVDSTTAGTAEPEGADLPFAILTLFPAAHDPRDSAGIGGHAAALGGAFATFQIAAIIREFGFQARRISLDEPDAAAAAAGLGTLDSRGRLKTPRLGTRVHIADVILTDLPVRAD
jgi:hypothetical protein